MPPANQVQYHPAAAETANVTLPDMAVPIGSAVSVIWATSSVTGTSPTLLISFRARTVDGSLVVLETSSQITGGNGGELFYSNCPANVFVDLIIGGTDPSFTIDIDLVVTPPAGAND